MSFVSALNGSYNGFFYVMPPKKKSWDFAAFASLYGCVLETMSVAKLLEDQEPEARIRGCMTLTVTTNSSAMAERPRDTFSINVQRSQNHAQN